MSNELLNIIKANQIFTSLSDSAIKALLKKFKKITLKRDQTLFEQGAISDGLYLIVSGKLMAILRTANNEEKILNDMSPGESIGEIGALSNEPRSATVKAIKNSVVLKLSCGDYRKLCTQYPSVVLATINALVNRSRGLIELLQNNSLPMNHILLVPANKNVSMEKFSERLQENMKNNSEMALLSDYDPDFSKKYKTVSSVKARIEELEGTKTKIISIIKLHETHLSKIAFERSNMVYIVGSSSCKPYINPVKLKRIRQKELPYKAKPDLILFYEKENEKPHHTREWLKLTEFGIHHNIRMHLDTDFQRLLRFMQGKAVGVVLGGGGVRSWAHVGALKALEEAGITIDAIGGTSAGAIVAGHYAIYETYEDIHEELHKLTQIASNTVSFGSVTWPAVSAFNGCAFTAQQKKMYGKYKIENLWLPFFCVSCNLAKNTPVIHRMGALWKRIRASSAVPGIYPPVIMRGKLHLDGGIVNNLPVDAMKKLSHGLGTVIAVELIHNVKDEKYYYFPPSLPFIKTMLAKFKIAYKDYKFPSFVEMFLRALLAGSSVKQNENALNADILISPDLSDYDLLRLSTDEEKDLIEVGYKAAVKALRHWKHKNANVGTSLPKGKSHELSRKRKASRNHSQ